MNMQKNKSHNLLYLLELTPSSEHVLEKIASQNRLEQIFYECAQTLDFEIDSCDIMFDFVAITLYVKPSVNIDDLVNNLKQQTSDEFIKELSEFKQFCKDGSLWNVDDNLELLHS